MASSMTIGSKVKRHHTIRYYGAKAAISVYDLGTVLEISGDRLRVLWHTYAVGATYPVKKSPKRTWVNRKFVVPTDETP